MCILKYIITKPLLPKRSNMITGFSIKTGKATPTWVFTASRGIYFWFVERDE